MRHLPSRGARETTPLALVLAAVAACGGSHPKTPNAAASPSASSPVAATTDPAVTRALSAAEAKLGTDRSYRFDAVETLNTARPLTTHLTGTVVRAAGVSYTLTVGRTTTQVIRLKTATYVRKVPGKWSKLRRKTPVVDPTASLLALLHGLSGASASTDASGTTAITGLLPSSAAKAAGVPTDGSPAHVSITVDSAGHVVAVTVRTTTLAASNVVDVTLVTAYTGFDRTRTLRPPV